MLREKCGHFLPSSIIQIFFVLLTGASLAFQTIVASAMSGWRNIA